MASTRPLWRVSRVIIVVDIELEFNLAQASYGRVLGEWRDSRIPLRGNLGTPPRRYHNYRSRRERSGSWENVWKSRNGRAALARTALGSPKARGLNGISGRRSVRQETVRTWHIGFRCTSHASFPIGGRTFSVFPPAGLDFALGRRSPRFPVVGVAASMAQKSHRATVITESSGRRFDPSDHDGDPENAPEGDVDPGAEGPRPSTLRFLRLLNRRNRSKKNRKPNRRSEARGETRGLSLRARALE